MSSTSHDEDVVKAPKEEWLSYDELDMSENFSPFEHSDEVPEFDVLKDYLDNDFPVRHAEGKLPNEHTGHEFPDKQAGDDGHPYESKSEVNLQREQKIKRILELRLQYADLVVRRNIAMETLTEQFESGLCRFDKTAIKGTQIEKEKTFEHLLMMFKEKKEKYIEKRTKLKEKKIKLAEVLELKTNEITELKENQYELELKTGVGMINPHVLGEKLTREDVVKLLDTCAERNKQVSDSRLKHIKKNRKCIKLKKEIEDLKSNASFDIQEYRNLLKQRFELELLLEKINEILSKKREQIITTKQSILDINEKAIKLKKIMKIKKEEFNDLKNIWRRNVAIESYNKKILMKRKEKALKNLDPLAENPALLKDYNDSVLQLDKKKKRLIELENKLNECRRTEKKLILLDAAEKEKRKRGEDHVKQIKWK